MTDTLTVTNPGGSTPPSDQITNVILTIIAIIITNYTILIFSAICGTNTGQHMFVPASDQCNTIQINIDTGSTTTTRWMGAVMF